MTTAVELFVDYVCPYCFLIEGALTHLRRERHVDIAVSPFELRPDPVPTLRPEDDYLPRVWNASVYPLARRVGLDVTLPSVSPQPRTATSFLVLQVANEHDLGERYSRAVFEAFFQHDRDIGDHHVILDVATSIGLDAGTVRDALDSSERRRRHDADLRYATDLGVTAVPSFRIAGQVHSGVLTGEQLIAAVDAAKATA